MLKFIRIASVVLLVAWMVLIFVLSAQTAEVSSQTSGGFITTVIKIFNWNFDSLSAAEKTVIVENFQFLVRKTAHFTIYFILGVFSFFSLVTYDKICMVWRVLIGGVICLLYSISDEIHQLFVVGRSCEVRDVLIDFCGAMLAISVLWFIFRKKGRFV